MIGSGIASADLLSKSVISIGPGSGAAMGSGAAIGAGSGAAIGAERVTAPNVAVKMARYPTIFILAVWMWFKEVVT